MRLKLPFFAETRDKSYSRARIKGFSFASLLSIALGLMLCLSTIYSGIGVAKADSMIATIPVSAAPVAIAFDSANGILYVTSSPNAVSVISGSSNTVIGDPIGNPILVGLDPEGIAFDPANGNIYVTNTSAIAFAPVQNGSTTTSNSIKFDFTTTGGVPPFRHICSLDGSLFSCSSGVAFASLPPGTHQFSIQTTDANGIKESTPVFSWTISAPLTPIQATQQLIQLKHNMHLAAVTDQVLDNQLNSALRTFQNNVQSGACGHLNRFAAEVQAFLHTGRLTPIQASQLLEGVQSVERIAGC